MTLYYWLRKNTFHPAFYTQGPCLRQKDFQNLLLAFALAIFLSLINTYFLEWNEQNKIAYYSFWNA